MAKNILTYMIIFHCKVGLEKMIKLFMFFVTNELFKYPFNALYMSVMRTRNRQIKTVPYILNPYICSANATTIFVSTINWHSVDIGHVAVVLWKLAVRVKSDEANV